MTDHRTSGVPPEGDRDERARLSARAPGSATGGAGSTGAGGPGSSGGSGGHDDQYLWDRSGTPDPAVRELESTLGAFGAAARGIGDITGISGAARTAHAAGRERVMRARRRKLAGIAAGLLVVLLAIAVWSALPSSTPTEFARLDASSVGVVVNGTERTSVVSLRPEMVLATKEHGSARVTLSRESRVELGDNTQVRIADARTASFAVELRSGEVVVSHAGAEGSNPDHNAGSSPIVRAGQTDLRAIGAADFFAGTSDDEFFVELKRGTVEAIFLKTRTRLAPGCRMEISRKAGPQVPVAYAASREFKAAMNELEGLWANDAARAEMLGFALKSAAKTDAVTLWNLAARVTPSERSMILKRADTLGVLAPEIDRSALMKGDAVEMDRWWAAMVGGR